MWITVDDGYQMYLDGRELSQGANWRAITEYDLTSLMTPGHHVLAINALNDFFAAGMRMDFQIGCFSTLAGCKLWRPATNNPASRRSSARAA